MHLVWANRSQPFQKQMEGKAAGEPANTFFRGKHPLAYLVTVQYCTAECAYEAKISKLKIVMAVVSCSINLYLNHCVARVCCKSARHWLTAVP